MSPRKGGSKPVTPTPRKAGRGGDDSGSSHAPPLPANPSERAIPATANAIPVLPVQTKCIVLKTLADQLLPSLTAKSKENALALTDEDRGLWIAFSGE